MRLEDSPRLELENRWGGESNQTAEDSLFFAVSEEYLPPSEVQKSEIAMEKTDTVKLCNSPPTP